MGGRASICGGSAAVGTEFGDVSEQIQSVPSWRSVRETQASGVVTEKKINQYKVRRSRHPVRMCAHGLRA